MEIILLGYIITVISVVLGFAISFYLAVQSKYHDLDNNSAEGEKCVVRDVVGSLKKLCPVNSGNRWKLLFQKSGLCRCWGTKLQLPCFEDNVFLCGAACAISCSSMYAFSLIADVTKMSEWEPLLPFKSLSLTPFDETKLQRDKFMQVDQVVGIQRGTDIQSYLAMYRFMSFSEKTVKWILFWNAKELEFMFFLIQPAVSKTVDSQCLVTHIFGSPKASHPGISVTQRLRNVKEYIVLSQLHVIASKSTPAVPAVSSFESPLDKPPKNQKLPPVSGGDCQHLFTLVPIYTRTLGSKKIAGFRLGTQKLTVKKENVAQETAKPKKIAKEISPKPESSGERLKRSVSDVFIKPPKPHKEFHSSLELNKTPSKETPPKTPSSAKSEMSYIVEEDVTLGARKEDNPEDASKDKKRCVSEPAVQYRRSASSLSDGSEHQTDEDSFVSLHIIHEDVPQENLAVEDRNELFCSSTSDFELLDSNQQFESCRLADFLTQGNYGASELQAEMMLASQFDKSSSFGDFMSGNWMMHSTYKGITVLSKATTGQFMKILSFLCQIELPVPYNDVWKCVKNPRFRFFSDETVKTVKIIERISNSQKLIHVYHETSGFLKKECLDFCLLQTEREETNHFYSSFHSIEYEKCPLMTLVRRGSLRPSGWVVEKLGTNRCKVTHLMQVIVNSSDSLYIQELNNLVPLAMHNLKNYTAAKPK